MSDSIPEEMMKAAPKPGSQEALILGCQCPVIDNGHGRGYMGQPDIFVYTVGCRVHDAPPASAIRSSHE